MDGVHVATLDAEVLHENLRDRCQAVGRAGSVGDDVVLLGVVDVYKRQPSRSKA